MAPLLAYCYITKEITVYEGEEFLSSIDQQTNRSQVHRPRSPKNDERCHFSCIPFLSLVARFQWLPDTSAFEPSCADDNQCT